MAGGCEVEQTLSSIRLSIFFHVFSDTDPRIAVITGFDLTSKTIYGKETVALSMNLMTLRGEHIWVAVSQFYGYHFLNMWRPKSLVQSTRIPQKLIARYNSTCLPDIPSPWKGT